MKNFGQLNDLAFFNENFKFDIKTFVDTDAVRLILLALIMSVGLYLIHNLSLFY